MSFIEKNPQGVLLRVRLTPNSCCCKSCGVCEDAEGRCLLKVSVISVPEKGKANQELIGFISKKCKIAKSAIKIIAGEFDRYKKIQIDGDSEMLEFLINEKLLGEKA